MWEGLGGDGQAVAGGAEKRGKVEGCNEPGEEGNKGGATGVGARGREVGGDGQAVAKIQQQNVDTRR